MANGPNTLTAVDLLIEAAKVDRVIAMSICGERVWLHAGDDGAHCSILSGTSRDKLRRERNDNNPANQSQRMTGRHQGGNDSAGSGARFHHALQYSDGLNLTEQQAAAIRGGSAM